jgi:hypothetical protein
MTRSTLCIADVSISRALAFELGQLYRCPADAELTMGVAYPFVGSQRRCHVSEDRYFTHIRSMAPPNSTARPGTWVTKQTGNIGYTW